MGGTCGADSISTETSKMREACGMESWGRAFQAVDRQEAMEAMVRRLDFIPSSVGGHWKVLSWEACDWIYFLECYPGCMEEAGGRKWERSQAG